MINRGRDKPGKLDPRLVQRDLPYGVIFGGVRLVLAESACALSKPACDVVFRSLIRWIGEDFFGLIELDHFAEKKKSGELRNPCCLLHAKDVRTSALQLFDSLRTLHRLPAEYREWLSAAAMLYEVGGYVNRSGRHRHAHYIIANSEILGYTSQQRRIIAAIARYLGKSRPTPGDAPTQGLSPVEQENIRKASLLLRLARAINLGRSGAVEKIRIQSRGGNVTLKIATRRRIGAELEMWAIEKDRTYFREVFGRELSVAAL